MKKAPKWTITLKQSHTCPSIDRAPEVIWTVVGLTNSVQFEVGHVFVKAEVENLCDSPNWKVIIK